VTISRAKALAAGALGYTARGLEVNDMKLLWGCSSLLAIALAVGCSATGGNNGFENSGGSAGDGGSGAGSGNQGGAGGFIPGTGGSGAGTPGDDCGADAKLVYVLSDANDLYSFDPPTKKFTLIGQLGCQTSMQPNSMAVDRNAVAWVNYVESDPFLGEDTNGVIYKVSTKDASCDPAPTVKLISNWFRLGMGFSTNGDGQNGETLYVTGTGTVGGGNSPGLGKINPLSFGLETIANFSPSTFTGQSAELTGTGDGRLYGYFTTSPVQVGQIDRATGAVTNTKAIAGLETPSAWAFSFWGGSFYLYAASLGNSNVTKYDPVANTVDNTYMTDIGFRIVGAGVSTCAPLEPPK
jgi:hypothetical protein